MRCLASYYDNWVEARDPAKHPEIYLDCERALRIDPGNTRALDLLSQRLWRLYAFGVDVTSELEQLDGLVSKALTVNPKDTSAHAAKGPSDNS